MDPKVSDLVKTVSLVIIALFIVLAYFNGWG
jgi:hypothetical protein